MYSLGIDIGSSSIKISMLDIQTGKCATEVTLPEREMPINAPHKGWAEQDPDLWWEYVCQGIQNIGNNYDLQQVACIGITYQMHGLVCLDASGAPLRPSIIWCDSRAVEVGRAATEALGTDWCQQHLLNHIGNFTAAKLAWVQKNEPDIFARIHRIMLPGDYIAYKLSGAMTTTQSGLSEGIFWDYQRKGLCKEVFETLNINTEHCCEAGQSVETLATTSLETENLLGIPAGVPISYRVGDQPNNAFSLNVMEPGEVAATGGTSGVVYGVTDQPVTDKASRVNPFLHVNHTTNDPRYGVLLCLNGCGSANAWVRRNFASELSYEEINSLAETAPAGCDGLTIIPFGNGAERVLENQNIKAQIHHLDFNRHNRAHLLRATQEGIAFAFCYGIDIMKSMGLKINVIRAGQANLFLSPLFCKTLATVSGAKIELYNTDGALGAARGAAMGAGFYTSREEAFDSLQLQDSYELDNTMVEPLKESYQRFLSKLNIKN